MRKLEQLINRERPQMKWQEQVRLDMGFRGVDETLISIMETCKFTDDRGLTAEAKSALKWNGYCWWALPRSLSVVKEELRLIDNLYFRSWVCELDGVRIDGHVYVNEGSGCCQQCGE